MAPVAPNATKVQGLPATVWALGLTSLFMDISSELIHGLLPLFLVLNLGASAAVLGLVEGIAEATAQISRVFSGWLSDALGKRKALAVAGYGLAAADQAALSAGELGRARAVRALCRSRRQGHPRRAARCPHRRCHAAREPRRGLRPAPVARHRRRGVGAIGRDRAHGAVQRRHSHRAVVRRAPGADRRRHSRPRRE